MLLWIDACARSDSRTRQLTEYLLTFLKDDVTHLKLYEENLPTIDGDIACRRTVLARQKRFDDKLFAHARLFSAADTVVFSAPYWDLSFPAVLKKYIESVCVAGLTFRYDENGAPVGLCRAKRMFYVSTAGGPYLCPEFGYGYIKTLCEGMFGIRDCRLYYAENLDIIGSDMWAILNRAEEEIKKDFA